MTRFYITTPIYYVNDVPHIGHAYTTVVADVLARYHRLFGHEVKFLTGVDEHGQKVQTATVKNGVEPQAYVDSMAENFKAIWKELSIQYDVFFRTTDEFHKKAVQACLQQLFDAGEIYAEDYEGHYSVSEEIFYTEKDLVNGKTPFGNEVTVLKEKNYFFRMSKYQAALIKHIEETPGFIEPEFRKNEVLGFLRKPLHDLCISRPKARLSWGIELPFDKDYVTYVWFDALLNYATGVGYQQPARLGEFQEWWQETRPVHLLGKDILTTHAVYWPTMLMALGIPLPKTIFAHGWWLIDGEKMSKSKGTVVKPLDMKDAVGVDPLRYFLTRDIALGNDASFSPELVISRVNSELANNLGNLLSRVTNLVAKNFDGKSPAAPTAPGAETSALLGKLDGLSAEVKAAVLRMEPQAAVQAIVEVLNETNKYIGDRAPWKQVKEDLTGAGETLGTGLEVLKVVAILLSPVMPEKCASILATIGWDKAPAFADAGPGQRLGAGRPVQKAEPLFPRVEWKPVP
ncbi:MAG: methionine--tRNA ligase [Proteobacteria bacterium]|nr:MAG: methionine--tRNA ligase [Pseudomonadota bacterium]